MPYKFRMAQMRAKLYFCYINRASIVELKLTVLSVLGDTWSDAGMELADDPLYAMKHADTKVICQILLKNIELVKLISTSTAVCITDTQKL